jgi:hypothetical protein
MIKSENILIANYLGKANREKIIKWLVTNDPHGCYSDQDSINEGYEPITREEALKIALNQLELTIY